MHGMILLLDRPLYMVWCGVVWCVCVRACECDACGICLSHGPFSHILSLQGDEERRERGKNKLNLGDNGVEKIRWISARSLTFMGGKNKAIMINTLGRLLSSKLPSFTLQAG